MADYDEAAQMSIITVLAEEAGVSTRAITLRITSGSVVVTFIIFVDSQARADNMASTLATGVMASPATFEAALVNGFQRVCVHSLADALSAFSDHCGQEASSETYTETLRAAVYHVRAGQSEHIVPLRGRHH